MAQNKTSTDNKIIKNALLSNVHQSSLFEEIALNPLLVPAAPRQDAPDALKKPKEGGNGQEVVGGGNPLKTSDKVNSPSSLPLQQEFTDIPLTGGSSQSPTLAQAGPPPLTGFTRLQNLSRYPTNSTSNKNTIPSNVTLFTPVFPPNQEQQQQPLQQQSPYAFSLSNTPLPFNPPIVQAQVPRAASCSPSIFPPQSNIRSASPASIGNIQSSQLTFSSQQNLANYANPPLNGKPPSLSNTSNSNSTPIIYQQLQPPPSLSNEQSPSPAQISVSLTSASLPTSLKTQSNVTSNILFKNPSSAPLASANVAPTSSTFIPSSVQLPSTTLSALPLIDNSFSVSSGNVIVPSPSTFSNPPPTQPYQVSSNPCFHNIPLLPANQTTSIPNQITPSSVNQVSSISKISTQTFGPVSFTSSKENIAMIPKQISTNSCQDSFVSTNNSISTTASNIKSNNSSTLSQPPLATAQPYSYIQTPNISQQTTLPFEMPLVMTPAPMISSNAATLPPGNIAVLTTNHPIMGTDPNISSTTAVTIASSTSTGQLPPKMISTSTVDSLTAVKPEPLVISTSPGPSLSSQSFSNPPITAGASPYPSALLKKTSQPQLSPNSSLFFCSNTNIFPQPSQVSSSASSYAQLQSDSIIPQQSLVTQPSLSYSQPSAPASISSCSSPPPVTLPVSISTSSIPQPLVPSNLIGNFPFPLTTPPSSIGTSSFTQSLASSTIGSPSFTQPSAPPTSIGLSFPQSLASQSPLTETSLFSQPLLPPTFSTSLTTIPSFISNSQTTSLINQTTTNISQSLKSVPLFSSTTSQPVQSNTVSVSTASNNQLLQSASSLFSLSNSPNNSSIFFSQFSENGTGHFDTSLGVNDSSSRPLALTKPPKEPVTSVQSFFQGVPKPPTAVATLPNVNYTQSSTTTSLPQSGPSPSSVGAVLMHAPPLSTSSSPLNPPSSSTDKSRPHLFQQPLPLQTIPPPPRAKTPSHTPPPPYTSLGFSEQTQQDVSITDSRVVSATADDDGLEQIPLEDTVPLFNPERVVFQKLTQTKDPGNTYRLGIGLKKPTYAPVPDLSVAHHKPEPMALPIQQNHDFPSGHGDTNDNASPELIVRPASVSPQSSTSTPPPESFTYNATATGQIYRPPYHHWFYKKGREAKSPWQPFSMADSLSLEQVFTSPDITEETIVATDGGRYDVEVLRRKKIAVYWEEPVSEVRRCSWFVRTPIDARYIPYDENIAEILEDAYKTGCLKNEWNKRVELADGEVIILHSPNAMAHHQRSSSPDTWGNAPPMQQKPRIVKRGLEDFEISEGEPNQVDHLLLIVHGIGKVCDLRFRCLVEVVDDFRLISQQLVQSHFKTASECGNVGRVEVLPVEWHRALHTEAIDRRLADITLPSIPRAREFTNETLLDILFYTSPVFCEKIVQAVGAELNRVYNLYIQRNPGFKGGVSIGGHSLGSLILFDMLSHQRTSVRSTVVAQSSIPEDEDVQEVGFLKTKARLSRRMSYLTIGQAGTGQPYIIYPQLQFHPKAFFAFGSPIGMFVTVRGMESLGEDFKFPTCPRFFNIFHPNDPVAYRIEALIKPEMAGVPAVLIPHHKGRKRMHLELKDTMAHVTTALKQKLVDSMRSTWNTVYQLAMFHRPDSALQQEVDKVLEDEVLRGPDVTSNNNILQHSPISEDQGLDLSVGALNGGNRIDYVLQEAPLETFNQYISAVRSHVVYWESEDTMLLVLKEIYGSMGISSDCQVPQQILPFDISGDENYTEYTDSIGAPPTQFVRK